MSESRYSLEDFELYQLAREYRKKVYKLVRQLPPEERYCLVPQIRRAALSVSNNIAEGHGRWHWRENIQLCRVARGSIEETIDDLNTCLDEGCGESEYNSSLKAEAYTLIRRVNGYIAYVRNTMQGEEK